jgi:hypothetical protein
MWTNSASSPHAMPTADTNKRRYNEFAMDDEKLVYIYTQLARAELFEKFLGRRFSGAKRYNFWNFNPR